MDFLLNSCLICLALLIATLAVAGMDSLLETIRQLHLRWRYLGKSRAEMQVRAQLTKIWCLDIKSDSFPVDPENPDNDKNVENAIHEIREAIRRACGVHFYRDSWNTDYFTITPPNSKDGWFRIHHPDPAIWIPRVGSKLYGESLHPNPSFPIWQVREVDDATSNERLRLLKILWTENPSHI